MENLHIKLGIAEEFIAKILIVFLTALVFISAVARNIGEPISWGIDLSAFLFAWCVFLSGDIALRKDRLVSVTFLTKKLPQHIQTYIFFINQLLMIMFLVTLIIYGVWVAVTSGNRTLQGLPIVSYTWVTLSVPFGAALMLITTIVKVKDRVIAFGNR